jgi:hypothetical protein
MADTAAAPLTASAPSGTLQSSAGDGMTQGRTPMTTSTAAGRTTARRIAVGWLVLSLAACAPALPPYRAQVTDLRGLAGTYTGNMNEASQPNRSVRLVLEPTGIFELVVSDPRGFRTGGVMAIAPDGSLGYQYDEMAGQGRTANGTVTVWEGDGRRALVLRQHDGSTVTTVARSLP